MSFDRSLRNSLAAIIAGALLWTSAGPAAPFVPGNLLYSDFSGNQLVEITPTGSVVQRINVPPSTGNFNESRDLVILSDGRVGVYNGTFTPLLSIYNPLTNTWASQTLAGWSTVNDISYGGLAASNGFLYATDMMTFNGGEQVGIVRFDPNGVLAPARFTTTTEYRTLSSGPSGRLFALTGTSVDVFSVAINGGLTFDQRVTLQLASDMRSLAVAADGHFFAVDLSNQIFEYTAAGALMRSVQLPTNYLDNIQISPDGTRLMLGTRFSPAYTISTSLDLASLQTLNLTFSQQIFGAFVPIPEPGTLSCCLAGAGLWAIARRRAKRRAGSATNRPPARVRD